ncbi:hypothetical protein CLAFUW4_13802 [Fulvia fulva]|uniref:F-box domain-containing protein n=1 Tax=Passalora fulva TaxID=5499 RepID=A0A9Q8UVR8_PASFU|nr:uncharacterized protein CLAFUR5_13647 [Fulvia fulva]KAK4610317.1 hypothetical protein CLAFUR4_13805 [Fulvia fulva]KAK4610908.1 hypothetical protein CLAFUR0_13809 [Fulvia fulva]UJO24266.1 hypothetical protein CLAFUR5_13647 [Fulvia fulva]WPV22146.1 hypothetical protein CLAFUW4_13802 [Fulvia fulva]WPV37007.1 hypothetical protein CLAFUW7_13810 [Fulvia fulva]
MTLTRKRSTVAPACLTKASRRRLTLQKNSKSDVRDDRTPQQQVFGDPKLLEHILAQVGSMQTLLLSQRVDTTFQKCIKGSPLLRQKLWLEPDPDMKMWHLGRLNPLLSRSVSRKKHKHILALSHSGCDVCILTTMNARSVEMSGSWRDMLIYQPHSPFAVFKTADCWASGESFSQNHFKDPPTAGQLVNVATSRSQKTLSQPATRPLSADYDRKCGYPATGHGCHRAKVSVP